MDEKNPWADDVASAPTQSRKFQSVSFERKMAANLEMEALRTKVAELEAQLAARDAPSIIGTLYCTVF